MGLPTVLVTRQGFSGVVTRIFAGMGLPAEASQVIYPHDMFVPGSDLSPIEDKIDELIAGLTTWQPHPVKNRLILPPIITIEGEDYETAASNVNRLFLKNMWSDGLPINPPTAKNTEWIFTGTDLPPEKKIIKIMPRGGIATVETIAISLAMAGGRPEYLPVLIAALEAMGQTPFRHELMNATTCSVYPVVMVSGPVARQIRLGSGYGCLGPDPLHPAGASIGRAIRLLLQNVGGALPGSGTMSIFGGPARYTNIVFSEDEKNLPPDWKSLSEEQGFSRGSNIVSAYAVSSTTNVPGGEVGNEDSALASLNRAVSVMGVANGNYWVYPYNPEGTAGILLMAGGTAKGLSKMGWSKEKIREYLWQNSKVPASRIGPPISAWWIPSKRILQDPMPISMEPKGIKIVVAGGAQSGHMMWLQVGCCPESITSAPVTLPAHWNEMLKKAEEDLGPIPHEEGDTLQLF